MKLRPGYIPHVMSIIIRIWGPMILYIQSYMMKRKKERKKGRHLRQMKKSRNEKWVASGGMYMCIHVCESNLNSKQLVLMYQHVHMNHVIMPYSVRWPLTYQSPESMV